MHAQTFLKTVATLCVIAAVGLPVTACKKPSNGRQRKVAKATIRDFDPNQDDFQLDLNKYTGSKRPDEYRVEEAFNRSFGGVDKCVSDFKSRENIGSEDTLAGDLELAVRLDPENARPLAVHAKITDAKLDGDKVLKDCLREAVAGVGFPTYDGPPVVANSTISPIDPGFEYED